MCMISCSKKYQRVLTWFQLTPDQQFYYHCHFNQCVQDVLPSILTSPWLDISGINSTSTRPNQHAIFIQSVSRPVNAISFPTCLCRYRFFSVCSLLTPMMPINSRVASSAKLCCALSINPQNHRFTSAHLYNQIARATIVSFVDE